MLFSRRSTAFTHFTIHSNIKNVKNLLILGFAALMSPAAYAQQTAATSTPVAEKKACCAPGQTKTGAACANQGATTNVNSAPAASAVQKAVMVKKVAVVNDQLQTVQFQVWGNCGMCKTTIEKAAKSVAGVESTTWNMDTDQLTVVFNPAKAAVDKVHQAIAAAGYDTDAVKGNDAAYNNLHGCCQYERRM